MFVISLSVSFICPSFFCPILLHLLFFIPYQWLSLCVYHYAHAALVCAQVLYPREVIDIYSIRRIHIQYPQSTIASLSLSAPAQSENQQSQHCYCYYSFHFSSFDSSDRGDFIFFPHSGQYSGNPDRSLTQLIHAPQ